MIASPRTVALAGALASALAACNVLVGLDNDYEVGAEQPGAASDASAGSDGATAYDAKDAFGDPDARSDGGSLAPGDAADASGPVAFDCSSPGVIFCTTFDTPVTWDGEEQIGGSAAVEPNAGRSGAGLHAHLDDTTISRKADKWKAVTTTSPTALRHFDVSWDFMVSAKSIDYAALGVLAFDQPQTGLPYYGLAQLGDVLDNTDDGIHQPDRVGVTNGLGVWHRATITFDQTATPQRYDVGVWVDATQVATEKNFDIGDASGAHLRIGAFFSTTEHGTMDVFVDNVLVRAIAK